MKLPKAVWIPLGSVAFVSIVGCIWTSRTSPPIPLLGEASPQIVRVEADRLATGVVRKIFVYRFEKNYFDQLEIGMKQLNARTGWRLDAGGEEPDWVEFQKDDESVEFVNDVPTDFNAKSNGVMWSPAGKTGKAMTIFYSRPASGLETLLYEISGRLHGKP